MRERLADWLLLTTAIGAGIFVARIAEAVLVLLLRGMLRVTG
jgi:hypothetical protein